jgi:hypothetical protein
MSTQPAQRPLTDATSWLPAEPVGAAPEQVSPGLPGGMLAYRFRQSQTSSKLAYWQATLREGEELSAGGTALRTA